MPDLTSVPECKPEWAAFASIDWADKKHAWRLVPADSSSHEQGSLENTPEAVDVWATSLSVRFGGRPIAVILEQSRGALVYILSKYAHLVLFPVHPTTASRYRKVFSPSGAKDDPRDADSMLDLLLHHRDKLRRWNPDTVTNRHLQRLVEHRRLMVNESTRQNNRLTACLKMYFPQILQWFDDLAAPLVGDFLKRWPTLRELQGAHPGTIKKFFLQHNSRSQTRIAERIESIYRAVQATNDEAVLLGETAVAMGLLALLKTLRENIASLDKQIEKLAATHPDASIFASFPSVGPVMLPRLIVALGSDRERYDNAGQVQCYSGIAPITEASGKSRSVHFRWACPKFLRQTFHEYAFISTRESVWAKAYYDEQRAKGKSHPAAVRALAYKWIRIIVRCWKDRKPYDEATYMRSLKKHNSPLGKLSATLAWEEVAGFKKLSIKHLTE
jgi:transposase